MLPLGEGGGGFSSGSMGGRKGGGQSRWQWRARGRIRSTRVEPKGHKNDDGKDGGTVDASQWSIEVDGDGGEGSGAEGHDEDGDQGAEGRLSFYFEVKFHRRSRASSEK